MKFENGLGNGGWLLLMGVLKYHEIMCDMIIGDGD